VAEDNQIPGIFHQNGGSPRPAKYGGRAQPLLAGSVLLANDRQKNRKRPVSSLSRLNQAATGGQIQREAFKFDAGRRQELSDLCRPATHYSLLAQISASVEGGGSDVTMRAVDGRRECVHERKTGEVPGMEG
jgi:hypothetical protein